MLFPGSLELPRAHEETKTYHFAGIFSSWGAVHYSCAEEIWKNTLATHHTPNNPTGFEHYLSTPRSCVSFRICTSCRGQAHQRVRKRTLILLAEEHLVQGNTGFHLHTECLPPRLILLCILLVALFMELTVKFMGFKFRNHIDWLID